MGSVSTQLGTPEPAVGGEPPRPEPSALSRRPFAVAGALTGAAGVAVSQAVATALGAESSPVDAVAAAVRDLTPGHLAVDLVHLVGHLDKPLLVGGTTVVLLAIVAYAATWLPRRPLVPDLVLVGLAVLGLLAVLREPRAGTASALALGAGLITWFVALRLLTAPLLRSRRVAGAGPGDPGRRRFLGRAVVLVGGVAVLSVLGELAGGGRRQVAAARAMLRLPVTGGREPAGADLGVSGIAPWRTAAQDFYLIHTEISPPTITPADWSLRIHGMVDRELTISYTDLVRRQLTEAWVTLCCVSNEVGGDLIGNAWWSGVLVRELLAEAGVHPEADAVKQTSHDGWTCGTPIQAVTDDRNAMLAVAMNGSPLPVEHGFPVRTIVPGLYGYVSGTKWLVDLEVTQFSRFSAFWTDRGWSPQGPVKTESRVDVPRSGATVRAGRVRVGGSAWAQHTGIAKVEFQVDGGPWQVAQLGQVPGVDTWVQWSGTADVRPGDHRVTVRATDRSGYTQTSVPADVLPDGATGWDRHTFSAQA